MSKLSAAFLAACSIAFAATVSASDSLVQYTVDKSDYSIPQSLTGKMGDPEVGRKVAVSRKKGNCLACHTMPIPDEPFHGRIAPPLTGVGARYSAGQLRLRLVNPKLLNPRSIMPAFYKANGFHRVADKFAGKPILSAEEVEDVVAYLGTLK